MLIETPSFEFGQPAPGFDLATPMGERFMQNDIMGQHGMLIAFICNHCPYVVSLIDRLVKDSDTLVQEGIGVAYIMSNDYAAYPADSPDKMQAFAEKHRITFPYLVDQDQSVARAFGAVCTPDFFGFNAEGALQYRGRLDDLGMKSAGNRTAELLAAMRRVAQTGRGPAEQTPSMGCSIKWR